MLEVGSELKNSRCRLRAFFAQTRSWYLSAPNLSASEIYAVSSIPPSSEMPAQHVAYYLANESGENAERARK